MFWKYISVNKMAAAITDDRYQQGDQTGTAVKTDRRRNTGRSRKRWEDQLNLWVKERALGLTLQSY